MELLEFQCFQGVKFKMDCMEASTGIEPVYTDLQSAASPLRQLAADGVGIGYTKVLGRASHETRLRQAVRKCEISVWFCAVAALLEICH